MIVSFSLHACVCVYLSVKGQGLLAIYALALALTTSLYNLAVAVIGFVENYDVTEGSDNTVSVEIQLLSGELERSVEVRVFTVNDSAQGSANNHAAQWPL